ncbi:MAG: hypothetical protein HDS08_06985 [Bacteroides sp.]|nr:hypothetical protein [Bacteroides sp.]
MSENRKSALKAIYKDGWGYIKDLQEKIGNDLLSEFISVGFIICGYTRTSKTWRISNLGKSYVRDLDLAN